MLRVVLRHYRAAYAGLPPATWIITAAIFVNRAGTMVLPFLALYLTREIGFSIREVGWLMGLWWTGGVFGTYLGGWLSDRIAVNHVQIGSLVLTGVGFPVLGFVKTKLAFAVLMLVITTGGEAFRPANAVALAGSAPPHLRSRAAALRRLAANLGMAVGPAVGGLLATRSYLWLFVGDGGTCLLAALFFFVFAPATSRRAPAREVPPPELRSSPAPRGRGSPWHDRPFLVFLGLVTVGAMLLLQAFSTLLVTLRDHYHLAEDEIGMVLALNPVLIVVFEMVLVHAVSRLPPLRMIGLGTLLVGLGFGILPLGSSLALAGLSVAIWSFGEMLLFPIAEGFTANRSDVRNRGRYFGMYTTATAVSMVLAPTVCMWVYDSLGMSSLWLATGIAGGGVGAAFFVLDASGLMSRGANGPSSDGRPCSSGAA